VNPETNATPEVTPEIQPTTEQPKPPSPGELFKRAFLLRELFFKNNQATERKAIAKRRGLFSHLSVEPTQPELEAAVRLPEDDIRLVRVALDSHGLPALPKAHGRRKPRMTKAHQRVKSYAIQAFRPLFAARIAELKAAAEAKGEQFVGIPQDEIPKIGARAAMVGLRQAKAKFKNVKRLARNRSKLSRKINAGILPGNTNVHNYIIN
jgi:hypothetical protein